MQVQNSCTLLELPLCDAVGCASALLGESVKFVREEDATGFITLIYDVSVSNARIAQLESRVVTLKV